MIGKDKDLKAELKKNFDFLKDRIQKKCLEINRDPDDVTIVAVSKKQSVEKIKILYDLGQKDFGENYVQELCEKRKLLQDYPDIRWHMLGPAQKNKVKFLKGVSCVQSIHSLSLIEKIESMENFPQVSVLIQMVVDPSDTTKSGCDFSTAQEIYQRLQHCKNCRFEGFMGIGPHTEDIEKLKMLYEKFVENTNFIHVGHDKVVSLGMTNDFEIGLESDSNMIRVGTGLFGARDVK